MTTSLSVASVIEKNRLSSEVPWLMLVDIGVIDPETSALVETMRVVRNPDPVVFNGHEYSPASFDIELNSEAGAQSTVNLTFRDYTLAVQRKMQDYAGGVGFSVAIAVVNADRLDAPPEVIENFQVTSASNAAYDCSFTLGAENNIARTFPRRRQMRDYCQWRFKGEECGYTGPLNSCDLSLKGANGCAAHQNVVRFGGFPGINGRDVRYG